MNIHYCYLAILASLDFLWTFFTNDQQTHSGRCAPVQEAPNYALLGEFHALHLSQYSAKMTTLQGLMESLAQSGYLIALYMKVQKHVHIKSHEVL